MLKRDPDALLRIPTWVEFPREAPRLTDKRAEAEKWLEENTLPPHDPINDFDPPF